MVKLNFSCHWRTISEARFNPLPLTAFQAVIEWLETKKSSVDLRMKVKDEINTLKKYLIGLTLNVSQIFCQV